MHIMWYPTLYAVLAHVHLDANVKWSQLIGIAASHKPEALSKNNSQMLKLDCCCILRACLNGSIPSCATHLSQMLAFDTGANQYKRSGEIRGAAGALA